MDLEAPLPRWRGVAYAFAAQCPPRALGAAEPAATTTSSTPGGGFGPSVIRRRALPHNKSTVRGRVWTRRLLRVVLPFADDAEGCPSCFRRAMSVCGWPTAATSKCTASTARRTASSRRPWTCKRPRGCVGCDKLSYDTISRAIDPRRLFALRLYDERYAWHAQMRCRECAITYSHHVNHYSLAPRRYLVLACPVEATATS